MARGSTPLPSCVTDDVASGEQQMDKLGPMQYEVRIHANSVGFFKWSVVKGSKRGGGWYTVRNYHLDGTESTANTQEHYRGSDCPKKALLMGAYMAGCRSHTSVGQLVRVADLIESKASKLFDAVAAETGQYDGRLLDIERLCRAELCRKGDSTGRKILFLPEGVKELLGDK